MHIAYVIAPGGGPEAYIRSLLPYLEPRGHRVSVVYTVGAVGLAHSFPAGVRVTHATAFPWHYVVSKLTGDFRAWPRRLRGREIGGAVHAALDRIHSKDPIDLIEVTEGIPVAALVRRWPVVLRAHGSDWTFRHFCQDDDRRWDALLIREAADQLQEATAVSAISRHLANHLGELCAFPPERIGVISYPIDTNIFKPTGVKDQPVTSAPSLLSIGRLEHRKGTDVLIKAMTHIWQSHPEIRVTLLGKEAQYNHSDLLGWLPKHHRDKVNFPGFVPHQALPGYYQKASIYVAPTQYETFGYTLLEAMSCGKPVISCRAGAIPELIEDGENGILVPFNDAGELAAAVTHLLENPALARQMGAAGRKQAQRYDLNRIGQVMEKLYLDTLDSFKGRR
ncbi:MAG: glycosyltransferase family 4 protein [Chloroflexota bacterium]